MDQKANQNAADEQDLRDIMLPKEEQEEEEDPTLIRWMLSMSPAERLAVLQQYVRSVHSIRDANPTS